MFSLCYNKEPVRSGSRDTLIDDTIGVILKSDGDLCLFARILIRRLAVIWLWFMIQTFVKMLLRVQCFLIIYRMKASFLDV